MSERNYEDSFWGLRCYITVLGSVKGLGLRVDFKVYGLYILVLGSFKG